MQGNNIIRSSTKGFRGVKTRVYNIINYIILYNIIRSFDVIVIIMYQYFCGLIIHRVNHKRDNNKTSQRDILLYMRSLDSH